MTTEEQIELLTVQLKQALEQLKQTQEQLQQTQEHVRGAQARIAELEKLKTPKDEQKKARNRRDGMLYLM